MLGFFGLLFAWQRGRKLKVLQEALRSGVVDPGTKRELLENTFGVASQRVPWLYRLGWFGMFVSAAMLFVESPPWWHWNVGFSWWTTAVFAFAMSLGAVTMPFAVKELQQRRRIETGRIER